MEQTKIDAAAKMLTDWLPATPCAAVVLGSGLSGLSERLSGSKTLPLDALGLPVPKVSGHCAELRFGWYGERPVLMLGGRVHGYEGYTMAETAAYVRVLHVVGIDTLILTNAAGAVNPAFAPGDMALIIDHIKLASDSPLTGPEPIGNTRFIDMQNAYDRELRALAESVALARGLPIKQGVYCYFAGPQYETPAEIRAAATLGADVVGMSTVPEVIMAAALEMRTLCFSLITNMAAGVTGQALSHEEVKAVSNQYGAGLALMIGDVLDKL